MPVTAGTQGGQTYSAVTTTQSGPDLDNPNSRGVKVILKTTVIGTGNITLTIQGKDPITGDYYTLLAGAAVSTNTTNIYTIFPGATASANVTANECLPRTWRWNVVANNANAATYSVSFSTLV